MQNLCLPYLTNKPIEMRHFNVSIYSESRLNRTPVESFKISKEMQMCQN